MTVNRLNRTQARLALYAGGWPLDLFDTMTAVGAAESSLLVDVVGPKNADGSEDLGWLQVNSRYVTGGPKYDRIRLLSDPAYNAKCAFQIFKDQGLGAWVAYTSGAHVKFMPPHLGGPDLGVGARAWFLVEELQSVLNHAGAALVIDGAFGPKTKAALTAWQQANPVVTDGLARSPDTVRLFG